MKKFQTILLKKNKITLKNAILKNPSEKYKATKLRHMSVCQGRIVSFFFLLQINNINFLI